MVNASPFVFPQSAGFMPITDTQSQGIPQQSSFFQQPQFALSSQPTTASSSYVSYPQSYPQTPGVITQPPVYAPRGAQVIVQPVYIPYNPAYGPPGGPGGSGGPYPPLPLGLVPPQPQPQPGGIDPSLIQALIGQLSQLQQQQGGGLFPPPIQPSIQPPPPQGFNQGPLDNFVKILPAFLLLMKLLNKLTDKGPQVSVAQSAAPPLPNAGVAATGVNIAPQAQAAVNPAPAAAAGGY